MSEGNPRVRSIVGEMIYTHRSRRGWSREELAARVQLLASEPGRTGHGERERMHQNTIANWEKLLRPDEKPSIPQLNTLRRVAEALGFAPDSDEYQALFAARHESAQGRRRVRPEPATRTSGPEGADTFVAAGRETYLRQLDSLARAARAGRSQVARVHAEPGAGKSAVLAELGRRLRDGGDPSRSPVVIATACREDDFGDGLGLARQVLATALGLSDDLLPDDSGASTLLVERLPAFVDAVLAAELPVGSWPLPVGALDALATSSVLDEHQRARLAAVIRASWTQPASDAASQAEAWADAIVMRARSLPGGLVLMVDDIHWAPEVLVSALSALVSRLGAGDDLPILLVLAWRPTDLHNVGFGAPHPARALIAAVDDRFPDGDLDLQHAVGGASARKFVEAMLVQQLGEGACTPAFVTALAVHTDGLPLFVKGMIRLLRDRGLIGAGTVIGVRDVDWSLIPAELEALFAEQVGHLDAPAMDILAWASVQGVQFSGEPLFAALGIDRDLGSEILERELCRHQELVRFLGERTLPDSHTVEHVWEFSHALLHEYVLRHMTPFERRRAHLRTGEALLSLHGDGPHAASIRIARHLEAAGDLARAATAWVRAGDQAIREGDLVRAAPYFTHVEEMGAATANPGMLVQSFLGRASCARGLGDSEKALQFAELGVRFARELADPVVLANALQVMSTVRFDRGQHREGIAALQEARPILLRLDNPIENCRIDVLLAFNLIPLGHYDEAMFYAREAVVHTGAVGEDRVAITARVALANVHVELGLFADALALYSDGVQMAFAHRYVASEALCWVNIGLCHVELGDSAAAHEALAQVHLLAREVPIVGFVAAAYFDAALLAESLGQLDAARRDYQRSLAIREEIGQRALQGDSLGGLLRITVAQGDVDLVRSLLARLERRLGDDGMLGSEHPGRLFVALIRGYGAIDQPDRAASVAAEAVAFLRERLAHIADSSLRRAFLEAVPTHRVLLAEIARILGVPVARLVQDLGLPAGEPAPAAATALAPSSGDAMH